MKRWAISCAVLVVVATLPLLSFLSFPGDLLVDDAAITLIYTRNLTEGHGYRYNATDERPVFGSSSLPFTCLAALLHGLPILDYHFLYLRLPGLLGYSLLLAACFLAGRLGGGYLTGIAALIYVASFPDYFVYADSGLESLVAAGLLACVFCLFYYQKLPVLFWVLCALTAVIKLDLVLASTTVVAAQIVKNYRDQCAGLKGVLAKPVLFYFVPVCAFFMFCWVYFGSPIPNSLVAKVAYNKSYEGFKYFHRFFSPGNPTSYFFFFSLIPIMCLLGETVRKRSLPSFQYLIILLVTVGLLLQLFLAPFAEVFGWYFVVPFLAFQLLVVFSCVEFARLRGRLESIVGNLPLLVTTGAILMITSGVGPHVFQSLARFSDVVNRHQRFLVEAEGERRSLGKYVKRISSPKDVFLTGHGWPAFESGITCIDLYGINTPQVVDIGGQDRIRSILEAFKPDIIMFHKILHEKLLTDYYLVGLGFRICRHFESGPCREWEVYRKRETPLNLEACKFLDLEMADKGFSGDSRHGTVVKITDSDYRLQLGSSIQETVSLDFPAIDVNESTVGAYCYLERNSSAVDLTLKVMPPSGETIERSITISEPGKFTLATLEIPGRHENVRLTITARADKGSQTGGHRAIHIRDPFVCNRLHRQPLP